MKIVLFGKPYKVMGGEKMVLIILSGKRENDFDHVWCLAFKLQCCMSTMMRFLPFIWDSSGSEFWFTMLHYRLGA